MARKDRPSEGLHGAVREALCHALKKEIWSNRYNGMSKDVCKIQIVKTASICIHYKANFQLVFWIELATASKNKSFETLRVSVRRLRKVDAGLA